MRRRFDMTPGAYRAVVFLLLLTLFLFGVNLAFTARQVHSVRQVEATAVRNTASVVQLCQAANTARAQQVVLWEHLVTISQPPPGETPAQRSRRLDTTRVFLAYIHRIFAQRNCAPGKI